MGPVAVVAVEVAAELWQDVVGQVDVWGGCVGRGDDGDALVVVVDVAVFEVAAAAVMVVELVAVDGEDVIGGVGELERRRPDFVDVDGVLMGEGYMIFRARAVEPAVVPVLRYPQALVGPLLAEPAAVECYDPLEHLDPETFYADVEPAADVDVALQSVERADHRAASENDGQSHHVDGSVAVAEVVVADWAQEHTRDQDQNFDDDQFLEQ